MNVLFYYYYYAKLYKIIKCLKYFYTSFIHNPYPINHKRLESQKLRTTGTTETIKYFLSCLWSYAYYMMGMKLKCMSRSVCVWLVLSVHYIIACLGRHPCKPESLWVDTVCVNRENHCVLFSLKCLSLHVYTHLKMMCVRLLIPDMWLYFTHKCTCLSVIHTILPRSVEVQTFHYPRRFSNGWPVLLLESHKMISELLFIYLESGIWTDLRDFLHNSSTICMNYTSNCVAYWGFFFCIWTIKYAKKQQKTKKQTWAYIVFCPLHDHNLYI